MSSDTAHIDGDESCSVIGCDEAAEMLSPLDEDYFCTAHDPNPPEDWHAAYPPDADGLGFRHPGKATDCPSAECGFDV